MFRIEVSHCRGIEIDGQRFVTSYNRTRPNKRLKLLPTGGETDVVIYKDGLPIAHGIALCSRKDNFCYKTGYKLALERALKNAGIRVAYIHYRLPDEKPPRTYDELCTRFMLKEWDSNDKWSYPETPSSKGGKTVCYFVKQGEILARGETRCSVKDTFCKKTGREIAYKRALAEFLS